MDLFTVFLESLLGRLADLAISSILRVKYVCPVCGQRDSTQIGNRQFNQYDCRNCHMFREQYTNACAFTVNPETQRIGHVTIVEPQVKWLRRSFIPYVYLEFVVPGEL